jgi:hypothetical protein
MIDANIFQYTINKTLNGKEGPMTTAQFEDHWIETRFVWGRCAAKDARAMRNLIRAFQSDGWPASRNSFERRPESKRGHR